MSDKAPDVLGPIVGFRAWALGPNYTLRSCYAKVDWPTDRPLQAICLGDKILAHCKHRPWKGVPHRGSRCGIWALNSPDHPQMPRYIPVMVPLPFGPGAVPIWGTVELWGHVIKAEYGYRAQYAQPKALYRPDDLIGHAVAIPEVAKSYGIGIITTWGQA